MKNALFGMLLVCAASASNNVFAQTAAERSAAEQDREQAKIAIKAVVEAMKHGDKADFEALGITLDELKVFCKASGGCQVTRDEAKAIASAQRKVHHHNGGHATKKHDDSDAALSQELLDLHVMLAVSMSGTDKVVADDATHFADSQLRVLNGQNVEYKPTDSSSARPPSTAAEQVPKVVNPPSTPPEKTEAVKTCPNGYYWKNDIILAQGGTIRDGDMVVAKKDNSGCFPIPGWQPALTLNPQPMNTDAPPNLSLTAPTEPAKPSGKRSAGGWIASVLGGGAGGAAAGCGIGYAADNSSIDPSHYHAGSCGIGALIGAPIGAGATALVYYLATR